MDAVRTSRTSGEEGSAERPRLSVGFILADDFTLSAFSLFVDHLRLAADEGDRSRQILCRWVVMGSREEAVRASCGIAVARTSPFVDPRGFDYIVVVGGLLSAGAQVDAATIAYLEKAAAAGVTLVGVCTGSFVLARAGLMTGRRCCVSWYHRQDFLAAFPHHVPVADRLFVDEGDRITCSGGGGVSDLATLLVERHLGHHAVLLAVGQPSGIAGIAGVGHAQLHQQCEDDDKNGRELFHGAVRTFSVRHMHVSRAVRDFFRFSSDRSFSVD